MTASSDFKHLSSAIQLCLRPVEPLSRALEYETCGGPPWTRTTYLRVSLLETAVHRHP
jgi:hypothetical protein